MAAQGRQQGFTLLEVMAAAVIFALVFGGILQVLSGSLRNVMRSADYTQAALWAETGFAAVGLDPPLEEGSYSGRFDDAYEWEIEIYPYDVATEELPDDFVAPSDPSTFEQLPPVELYAVDLTVRWGEERPREASFSTLRSLTPTPQ